MKENDFEEKNNELELSEFNVEEIKTSESSISEDESNIEELNVEESNAENSNCTSLENCPLQDSVEMQEQNSASKEKYQEVKDTIKNIKENYVIKHKADKSNSSYGINTKKSKRFKYLATGGLSFILAAIIFSPSSDIVIKIKTYDDIVEQARDLLEIVESLDAENKELKEKLEEAKPWFDLSEKEKEEQILNQAKEENATYLALVDSGKSYFNMTENERKVMNEWLDTEYKESISQLKDLYKDKYEYAVKDKEQSLTKIDAEKKAAEEKKKKEEEEAFKKAEAEKYNTGLTWEKIAREGMVGTLCQFKGNVLQVMKGDDFVQCRVATKDNYDDVMLIEVHDIDKTILEGDTITFKGMSMGTIEYTTVLGAEVSIPAVLVAEYTLK